MRKRSISRKFRLWKKRYLESSWSIHKKLKKLRSIIKLTRYKKMRNY